jgi:DNA invertase Pin-like site-specific DNA recombinase
MEDIQESGNAIIYARVSLEAQVEKTGLEVQINDCKKWAYRNELQVKGIYSDEGKSGKYVQSKYKNYNLINGMTRDEFEKLPEKEQREEMNLSKIEGIDHRNKLKEALKACKEGDVFLCFSMTRIARNLEIGLQVLNYLKEKRVFVVLVKDNLDSRQKTFKMQYSMLTIVAEMEHGMITDRVKSAMEYKKESQEFVGAIPFGWRLSDGKQSDLVPDEKEQEIIKLVKEMRKNKNQRGECWGYLKIAKELNKLGHKTKKGAEWGPSQVARIVNDKSVPQRTQGSKKAKENKLKERELEEQEKREEVQMK